MHGPNDNRQGSNNPNWKGGYTTDHHGYIRIANTLAEKLYPHAKLYQGAQSLLHRCVMEEHLGRPLRSNESVHHKNSIKTDNRLENLELRAAYHGKGTSISELKAWAREILERYPD